MLFFFAALIWQANALPPETWKERNHPDMPVLPSCDLGTGKAFGRISDLPVQVRDEITRFFRPAGGMSDAGGPFNATDVIDSRAKVPSRRFLRAYHINKVWIVWYERGGPFRNLQTIALLPQDKKNDETVSMWPSTTFAGNICAASKAIIEGVRSTSP